jgi:transposase
MLRTAVPLPDAGLIVRRTGKYKYVYKVIRTFRNEKGQPTNERILIGKLDDNGCLIPNINYYSYFKSEKLESSPDAENIRTIKAIGASFLATMIFKKLGITKIISEIFNVTISKMIQTIAIYMFCRGNIIEYIQEWCDEFSIAEPVLPQQVSYLFSTIKFDEIMIFFKKWISNNPTNCHIAYDITSFSTSAKRINDAEWGYNRDGDKLPQINLGFYLSHISGIPLFYVSYPGSIVDKSHMPYMMAYNDELGFNDITFVMDRGFCSTSNLQWLHSKEIKYVMAVDTFHKTTKSAIDEVKEDITSLRYRINNGSYAKSINSRFYGVKSNMHIYYIVENAERQREELFRLAVIKGEKLEQTNHLTPKEAKNFLRFYDICINKDKTFSYSINYNKIDIAAKYCGYFCILSNTKSDKINILSIYRKRDIIEKGFDDIKNYIDMKRMHTHNDNTTRGKLFCAFIALIATSQVSKPLKTINDSSGRRHLSKQGLVLELEKIKVVTLSNGRKLMNPLTKRQREILSAFDLSEQELKAYASCS